VDVGRWVEVGDGVLARRYGELDLTVGLVVGDGACLVVDTRGDAVQGTELAAAVRSVTAAPEVATGPLGVGAEQFGVCASCHGSNGEGGVGRKFSEGEVDKTFPHIEDQLRFVYFGTAQYQVAGVESYGNPEREGGPHLTQSLGVMPGQGALAGGDLTDDEVLAVVCHERYDLGGADPASDEWVEEFEHWCSDESPIYAALESGTSLADLADAGVTDAEGEPIEILPIGDAPAEGSPPG